MHQDIWILHGWAQGPRNQEKWKPFIDLLENTGVDGHFLEIPGLDSELREAWTLDTYADWLAGVLPETPVNLLGHSFGGQLAVKFATEYPGRINKLILIGPSGIKNKSLKAIVKRNVFKIVAKTGRLFTKSEVLKRLLYKLSRENDYLNAQPLLRETMKSVIDTEIIEYIDKIKQQTLLIWGKNDKASPYKFNHIYRKKLPGIVFKQVDARHSPQFTNPTETARLVVDFLEVKP